MATEQRTISQKGTKAKKRNEEKKSFFEIFNLHNLTKYGMVAVA